MHLLLFSDLHCDVEAACHLVEMSHQADIVVGAGDFATMRHGLEQIIGELAAIERPAVLVPGNSESYEELAAACQVWPTARVLHGSGVEIEGTRFWGVGGAIPITPFGPWSYDFSEEQGQQMLAGCPTGAILVSHSPPQGAVDRSSGGRHLGSTAVRQAIDRCAPSLVVCGHIHDSAGQSSVVGQTPVVNAGPQGMLWETNSPSSDCDQ